MDEDTCKTFSGGCQNCRYYLDNLDDPEYLCPEDVRLNRIETDIEHFAPDEE